MHLFAKRIRPTAVAGRFYPAQPLELAHLVEEFLAQAQSVGADNPKALVAPHAGYIYSGPIAGSAFRAWSEQRKMIRRVVLLGPSHHVAFAGVALPQATGFDTPLGSVTIDSEAVQRLSALPQVSEFAPAHTREHALEVELPFLQHLLTDFTIVPLVVGDTTDEAVEEVVDLLWDGDQTRFVLSSDLSHYHDYETARRIDRATSLTIESLRPETLSGNEACGYRAIRGFLQAAKHRGLFAQTLDLRNSGDTAGPRHSVVGYGAFAFAARPKGAPQPMPGP